VRPATWIVTLTVGVAIVVYAMGFAFASATVGNPAPPLAVQELNGETFDLATLRGKVVVINFWATWCPPCRAEMPALNAFYQRYHAEGLEMLGLSADRHHDRGDVTKVAQSISYPIAMLEDAKTNGFNAPSTLPMTFVIDREGVIRYRFTPNSTAVTGKALDDAVVPLLQQKPAGGSGN